MWDEAAQQDSDRGHSTTRFPKRGHVGNPSRYRVLWGDTGIQPLLCHGSIRAAACR